MTVLELEILRLKKAITKHHRKLRTCSLEKTAYHEERIRHLKAILEERELQLGYLSTT